MPKEKNSATESTLTRKKTSVETLAAEIKLVVTSKIEFEHGDKSIYQQILAILDDQKSEFENKPMLSPKKTSVQAWGFRMRT